ncbi:hypothetical protein N0V90_013299 [Kalmusia sp. IMI 367209]|nr:hypothetical protein N0V90_013299 [Kalmusia sp. IMI 367209]
MAPNQPDVARQVGERALNSDSGSEPEDEEMDNRSPTVEAVEAVEAVSSLDYTHAQSKPPSEPFSDLSQVAQKALDASTHTFAKPPAPPLHRDSVVEPDSQDGSTPRSANSSSQTANTDAEVNGVQHTAEDANGKKAAPSVPSSSSEEQNAATTNGHADAGSSKRAPDLHDLAISPREGSPSQRLPALQAPQSPLQDGLTHSPSQSKQQLPSFRHLSDLAETAIQEQETNRANSIAHRQSISSTGQSPTSVSRQLSITSLSPNSTFGPHSATSPSGGPEFQTRDPFLRSGQHLTLFSTRRPSQASESGPFSATTIHSATTENSYQSSEGVSPGAQVTPIDMRQRLSIDGALASRTLPLPVGPNIQHIPSHGSSGFKCDHPGCTALPFQTQYLLK